MARTLAALAALGLALAAPQAAPAATFVAFGEGLTRCTITAEKHEDLLHRDEYKWSGETTCDRPLEQTAQASFHGATSPLCSGVTTYCSSATGWTYFGQPYLQEPMEYRVTLRAPLGQGWIGAPTYCSGVGTDNLKCVFKVNDAQNTVWYPTKGGEVTLPV